MRTAEVVADIEKKKKKDYSKSKETYSKIIATGGCETV